MKKKLIIAVLATGIIACSAFGSSANDRKSLPIIPKEKLDKMGKYFPKIENKTKRLGQVKMFEQSFPAQLKLLQASDDMLAVIKTNGSQYYGYTDITVGGSRVFLIFNSAQDASRFMEILYSDLDIKNADRIKEANKRLSGWLKQEITREFGCQPRKGESYSIRMNLTWFKFRYLDYCQKQWSIKPWRENMPLQEKLRGIVEYRINTGKSLGENLLIFSKKPKDRFCFHLAGIEGRRNEIKYFLKISNQKKMIEIVYQLDNNRRVASAEIKNKGVKQENINFINKVYRAIEP